ncbi:MAG: GIY-YIG nuclease family protein [Metamycoplasmataceae bacterium]
MNLNNVPELPGVYLWKDINKNIIYVGKAKNLKKRMTQYFNGTINSFKTKKMVELITDFDFIICNNENEALLLERNLISKYKPFYNISLMDDRKYPYINISIDKTGLSISVKFIVNNENKNNLYYGPYINNGGSKIMLNFLRSECLYEKGLPVRKAGPEFWNKKFLLAKKILSKNNNDLISDLTQKMNYAADSEQYERASEYKDVIHFIKINKQVQVVEFKDNKNIDVLVGIIKENFLIFCIQFYRNGLLINSAIQTLEIKIDTTETIRQFVNQFYKNKQLPKKIITNLELESSSFFFDTEIVIPKKGNYFAILNSALKNAEVNSNIKIMEYENRQKNIIEGLRFLGRITNKKDLNHIIMIDNSNFKNTNAVSAIISYRNGMPQKDEYRKFNIVSNNRRSDVEYIKQGLTKYFEREENIPSLIIVDGGIHQLNEGKNTLKMLNIKVPIIGLVKNERHKTDFIISENGVKKNIDDRAYLFLSGMQEEVDRFAKSFYRNKSSKNSLEGNLIQIEGVGPKTELKILNHFKTYNNIYNASIEELEKVVSTTVANNIIKALKG